MQSYLPRSKSVSAPAKSAKYLRQTIMHSITKPRSSYIINHCALKLLYKTGQIKTRNLLLLATSFHARHRQNVNESDRGKKNSVYQKETKISLCFLEPFFVDIESNLQRHISETPLVSRDNCICINSLRKQVRSSYRFIKWLMARLKLEHSSYIYLYWSAETIKKCFYGMNCLIILPFIIGMSLIVILVCEVYNVDSELSYISLLHQLGYHRRSKIRLYAVIRSFD